jgi:hypothetical protein
MVWDIQIGKQRLALLQSVEIKKSVDLLADTATIVVPGVVFNKALNLEDKVKVGDTVIIRLGYDDKLVTEFDGYLQRIDTNDNNLTFVCEDAMFLTRKPVKDIQLQNTTVEKVAKYCLEEIGLSKLNCSYTMNYQKFVISRANAFDVLKKLQDETKANIYMQNGELNIHPPYIQKGGDVRYDFAINIEKSDLKYKNADDRKFEVTVEGLTLDGKKTSVTVGVTGGEKRTIKVYNVASEAELKRRGEDELKYLTYDGYEGSITGWLLPYVEPTFSAYIHDAEYEFKTGSYYVVSVETSFSANGGERKVTIGRKLIGNG